MIGAGTFSVLKIATVNGWHSMSPRCIACRDDGSERIVIATAESSDFAFNKVIGQLVFRCQGASGDDNACQDRCSL